MDDDEARSLIEKALQPYRSRSYSELEALVGVGPATGEIEGPSGFQYHFEIEVLWDARPRGNIRVIGAIDDMKWRSFNPVCADFIVAPDGSFVGE
jgi:hypothetical protein